MGIFNKIKTKVNNGINKGKAWCKKHPTATKVIGIGAAGLTVAGATLGVYAMTRKHEDEPEVTNTFDLPAIPEVPQIEEPKINENDGRCAVTPQEEEEDRKVWESDNGNWKKVMGVAKELDLKDEPDYVGYHIYKLGDDTMVAKVDENCEYHYAPDAYTYEEPETTEQNEAAE